MPYEKKSKAWAVLLSLVFPGSGHMYVGQLSRGLLFILAIIVDIVLIVFTVTIGFPLYEGLVTFLALLLPVAYLMALFDAAKQVEEYNASLYHQSQQHMYNMQQM